LVIFLRKSQGKEFKELQEFKEFEEGDVRLFRHEQLRLLSEPD
jgi:hypothetical protein